MRRAQIRIGFALGAAAFIASCAAPETARVSGSAEPAPAARPAPAAGLSTDPAPLNRNEVREAQALLGRLGFYSGEADGVVGPKSRAAAQAFEAQVGASPSGRFDRGLLVTLRSSAAAAGVTIAAAPPPI